MDIKAFLKENVIEKEPISYVASERFVVDGKPVAWKLRSLTNDEIEEIRLRCTKRVPIKGTKEIRKEIDEARLQMEIVLASIGEPDLDSEDLQSSWNVVGAEALLKAMLTPGELADLQMAALEASDFEVGMGDKIKEVKNG